MGDASYFRQKAEQCRRLATSIVLPGDPAKPGLEALAKEFDARATALEAETLAAVTIGFGDNVGEQQAEPLPDESQSGNQAKNSRPN